MDDENWLADELKKHRQSHKWTYVGVAVTVGLLVMAMLLFQPASHSKNASSGDNRSSVLGTSLQVTKSPSDLATTSATSPEQATTPSAPPSSTVNNVIKAENQQAQMEVQAQQQERCSAARNQYMSSLVKSADVLVNEENSIEAKSKDSSIVLPPFVTELGFVNDDINNTNYYNLNLLYNPDEGIIASNLCSPNLPSLGQVPPCNVPDYIDIGDCVTQVYLSIGLP